MRARHRNLLRQVVPPILALLLVLALTQEIDTSGDPPPQPAPVQPQQVAP